MALTTDQQLGIAVSAVGIAKRLFSNTSGAEVSADNRPFVNFVGANGEKLTWDYRAKLRVPPSFIESTVTAGLQQELKTNGGIVFPYTPQIGYETNAAYANMNLLHTNFPVYTYKHSGISAINLTAKFTVQNDKDAANYLGMIHLLRCLTKMAVGNEAAAGTPPPVCRLDAYGSYMIRNVPVVVSSFRLDFPDNVDYYRTDLSAGSGEGRGGGVAGDVYGWNFVPTSSQIVMSLLPMYSRKEQIAFNRANFIEGKLSGNYIGRGYL